MKKVIALLGLAICNLAFAEGPYDTFDVKKFKYNNFKIVYKFADNIQKACNDEHTRRGYKPLNYKLEACTFHSYDTKGNLETCLMILPTTVDFHTLGHETRHCFEGQFH